MKVITSPTSMQELMLALKRKGKSIGLVPTMGALHAGHLSLVSGARKDNDVVVVSIFVNPKQFGPSEDYLKYPRPFSRDRALCRKAGVDYIFAPCVQDMYPGRHLAFVNVEEMSDTLCGAFRPGHFRGVATVVAKLFNIVQPANAYFGMKDFQQLTILKKMAADLNFPVKIVPCAIIRENSGLALSSRNTYLSSSQHTNSALIYEALQAARSLIKVKKLKDPSAIVQQMRKMILSIPGSRIDYIAIVDPETLEQLRAIRLPVVIAIAAWVGKTRLIDNILIA